MSDRRERLLEAVKAAREMCNQVDRGPWIAEHDEYAGYDCMWGGWRVRKEGPFEGSVVVVECGRGEIVHAHAERQADFIARSRTLLPALLAVAEEQIESHHEIPANQAEQGLPAGAVMCCYGCNGGSLPCHVIVAWAAAFGVEE